MTTNLQLAQWGLFLATAAGQPEFILKVHRKRVEYFRAQAECAKMARSVTRGYTVCIPRNH